MAVTKYQCCYCCTVQTTKITGEEHPGKHNYRTGTVLSLLLYVANTYKKNSAGMGKNISAAEKNFFLALLGKKNILDSIPAQNKTKY